MGLRLRVALILLIPTVLAVGAHGALRVQQQEARFLREDRQHLEVTARAILIAVENALRDRQISDARRLLVDMVEQQEVIDRIRLFDRDVRQILVSNPLAIGEAVPSAALGQVIASGRPEVFYQAGPPSYLYYLAPLRGPTGAIEGGMEIVRLATAVDERRQAATLDAAVRLGILIVVIVATTMIAMQRQVLRPIAQLTGALRRFGRDQSVVSLPVGRRDEVGEATRAFNEMAVQLDAARRGLQAETERVVELEQHLRRAATLAVAGRLASALAHEVGTPLNIVSGRAEGMLKALPPDAGARDDLQIIIGQIERITRIINSLLDTVRPHRAEPRPTAVAEVLDPLLPLLRHAARQRQVTLEAETAPGLPAMRADPSQLQQVLINLVVNALEATPAGGRVTVRAERLTRAGAAGVGIAVADTGSGISPQHLPRLFEPFFTTKPRGQGTGLGLAITREIVRAHGGDIDVQTRVGAGTTLTAWIPAESG
ncbi:MAG TPA: ATP-binding protein [Methylomirabilota bacterium]|nr:ATP-binding protein [Methylomirabilota bacterium]